MKKALILFLFFPAFIYAQQTEKPVHQNELGLNLFSITHLEFHKDPLDKPITATDFNLMSGVYYKRHFGKNTWRASFDFTQKSIQEAEGFESPYYYSYSLSGSKRNIGAAIGYERSFGSKKIQPYVFADLIFNYQEFSGAGTSYGCFGPIGLYKFSEEIFEYGAAGGAGLRYSITPNIQLNYEFAAQGFVSVFQDVLHGGPKSVNYGTHLNPVNKLGFAVSF